MHVDGLRERHDGLVGRQGVFDAAVEAIRAAKRAGFQSRPTRRSSPRTRRPWSATCSTLERRAQGRRHDDLPRLQLRRGSRPGALPGGSRPAASLARSLPDRRRRRWRLNHSPLFLDFLEGKVEFDCTPWGIPCYSVLGWQRPCYLRAEGYARVTGAGRDDRLVAVRPAAGDPRCRDCMAHCGYEPTAVLTTCTRCPRSARHDGQLKARGRSSRRPGSGVASAREGSPDARRDRAHRHARARQQQRPVRAGRRRTGAPGAWSPAVLDAHGLVLEARVVERGSAGRARPAARLLTHVVRACRP